MAPASVADLGSTSAAKPTVIVFDKFHPDAIEHARTLFNVILNTDPEFRTARENATGILIRGSWLRAADIASYPKLRAIGKHGVGTDKIDAEACKKRCIAILNTPGANSRAVAELVLALTMAVARQVTHINTRQFNGEVVVKDKCLGLEMYGRTLGVVGMGNIGRTVARIFHGAFDAKIVVYDHNITKGKESSWAHIPHQSVSDLDEVVAAADVLTLHIPLTKTTRNLLSYERLCRMKPEAILINTARGGVINEQDLERVLREGRIWGVGLDCHEEEPPTRERYSSLWDLENVVSLPHIGACTVEARRASSMGAVENLYRYLAGEDHS